MQRLALYGELMRLHRPIGALLLLWPTLGALWLAADGQPSQSTVLIFVAGVWLMRSAGCVANDWADQRFDARVKRTQGRPLARQALSSKEALGLLLGLLLIAAGLVWQLNVLTQQLAVIALLLALTYPFAKRFHYLPQLHLGLAFGMAIPMAYAAVQQAVPPVAWGLMGLAVLWSLVYDTFYALADQADDREIGVKSSALWFGSATPQITGLLQGVLVVGWLAVGYGYQLGTGYFLGVLGAALAFAYQQWLISQDPAEGGFQAFLNNHWVGALIFAGVVLGDLPP